MRGRKPVPTALKEIRGNPGHRPMNLDEPDIAIASPTLQPPSHMTEEARAEWFRLIGQLVTSRVLTDGDIGIFASYCDYWAEYCFYAAKLKTEGAYGVVSRKDKNGKDIPNSFYTEWNPARIMKDSAWEKYKKAAAELGLTPSSRSRVSKDTTPLAGRNAIDVRAALRRA